MDDSIVNDVEQAAILVAHPKTCASVGGHGINPERRHAAHAAKSAVFQPRDTAFGRDPHATAIVLDQ